MQSTIFNKKTNLNRKSSGKTGGFKSLTDLMRLTRGEWVGMNENMFRTYIIATYE